MNAIPSRYAARVLVPQTSQNGLIYLKVVKSPGFVDSGMRFKSSSSVEHSKSELRSQTAQKHIPNNNSSKNSLTSGSQKVADVDIPPSSGSVRNSSANEINNNERDDAPLPYHNAPSHWEDTSSLSPYLRKHPNVYKAVKFVSDGFGVFAKQADAVRTGKKAYMACSDRDIVEEQWIYDGCRIPRTFHSWFQITNLHIWLLTVRFRALPPPHGKYILQSFVDFFFQDIEDRLRALLGPKISERTITSYMKEYRDLWNGSQLALDIGLVGGDWELAGALWRNLFDAKGWDLGGENGKGNQLVDATSTLPHKLHPSAAEGESPVLGEMPHHIYTLVAYLRRELKRLEEVPNEVIIQTGDTGQWGPMYEAHGGDHIHEGPIRSKELERWQSFTNEIGTYR